MKKNYILIFMLYQAIILSGCVTSSSGVYIAKAKICPSQLNWSIEELIGIALMEFDKIGGNSDLITFSDIIIRQIDCDIFIRIFPEPTDIIGNDFGVMISAESGKVLQFFPGK